MTTNTSYGTWNNRVDQYSLTVEQSVGDFLALYPGIDTDAVISEYRDAINAALPDSVALCGDEFYGHYYDEDCADQKDFPHDEDGRLDIAAIVEGVDFEAIVERIDTSTVQK
jgi:hypothetical protein